MHDVKTTEQVPSLSTSLLNTMSEWDQENFCHISYPLLDNHQCDMLIGVDNIQLFMQHDQTGACCESGDLVALQTLLGWVVLSCEDMTCQLHPLSTLEVDTRSENNTTIVRSNLVQSVFSTLNPLCTPFIPRRISSEHTYPKTPISYNCDQISAVKPTTSTSCSPTRRRVFLSNWHSSSTTCFLLYFMVCGR